MTAVWGALDTAKALRVPDAGDDKYTRGVLGVRTGSDAYPGAAVLGVEAAWRTGIGMVRYLGAERPTALVLQRRPETVVTAGRVQAWLIGSGTDAATRPAAETAALRDILAGDVPVILDAGALDLAAEPRNGVSILTPHGREHDRLRDALGLAPVGDESLAGRVGAGVETAQRAGAVLILKGAQTVVAEPGGWWTVVHAGTSWLATAGTGDVLGGVVGAVVAGGRALDERSVSAESEREQGSSLERWARRAAAGVWLHQRAGVRAVEHAGEGGGPVTALDVAAALPGAVAEALRAG
jgi:hydroxyethylthiazole kinase-like uncharacterized protein yjeF